MTLLFGSDKWAFAPDTPTVDEMERKFCLDQNLPNFGGFGRHTKSSDVYSKGHFGLNRLGCGEK